MLPFKTRKYRKHAGETHSSDPKSRDLQEICLEEEEIVDPALQFTG